ncbi:hypothetical protein OK074_6554 [Actinobacteria bacterium OK074]|nr:hypothetical protein OK074_6554 [Actinobacteria bacterium OK074]
MPHFMVHMPEEDLDGKVEAELVRALTDGVAEVLGEWARGVAVVELFGVPRGRGGVGGKPVGDGPAAPVVTLNLRERALTHPQLPDAPAQLIHALTEAVTGVLGEAVRGGVTVTLVGVREGGWGVGGVVV